MTLLYWKLSQQLRDLQIHLPLGELTSSKQPTHMHISLEFSMLLRPHGSSPSDWRTHFSLLEKGLQR